MINFSKLSYYGYTDDYASYSSCKRKKAMKEYECFITGKTICKGEEYKELCCWNPVRGKHFRFKLCLEVSRDVIRNLRTNPEQANNYKQQRRKVLGFFSC